MIMLLPEEGLDLHKTLSEIESHYIALAYEKAEGNVGKAADMLGLKRTTLVAKLVRKEMVLDKKHVPVIDPEGEFTAARDGIHWKVFYKGEEIATKRNITEVNKFLKEKLK